MAYAFIRQQYMAISIKACTWHLPVLSYPHVIKVGGVPSFKKSHTFFYNINYSTETLLINVFVCLKKLLTTEI